MAKIPWIAWIIVGLGMFLISLRVGEELDMFLYIAMFFLFIGFFKMVAWFILGGKTKKALLASEEIRHQQYSCPRCKNVIASNYGFCPHCGTRLQ